jgi:hypothetical protein
VCTPHGSQYTFRMCRYRSAVLGVTLSVLGLGACSKFEPDTLDGSVRPDASIVPDAESDPSCIRGSSSTLPGVRIDFCTSQTTFSLAEATAGITVPYRLVADQEVTGVYTRQRDDGGCGQPGVSGLILLAVLSGNGQRYCLCDIGLCRLPPSDIQTTVHPGTYPATFAWDGRNWTGPSDFNQPKGLPFPAGDYLLTVSSIGQVDEGSSRRDFAVTSTVPIRLVP